LGPGRGGADPNGEEGGEEEEGNEDAKGASAEFHMRDCFATEDTEVKKGWMSRHHSQVAVHFLRLLRLLAAIEIGAPSSRTQQAVLSTP
jgi:hypothetical protein